MQKMVIMKRYHARIVKFLGEALNRFLEVSFQRTEDRLMRKKK